MCDSTVGIDVFKTYGQGSHRTQMAGEVTGRLPGRAYLG